MKIYSIIFIFIVVNKKYYLRIIFEFDIIN